MLKILPLASSFHSADQVHATVAGIAAQMRSRDLPHRLVDEGGETPNALLIVTGGTEHLALEAISRMTGPALLLAHPHQNSLPASLEILSRLRQWGQPGRILLLNDLEDGFTTLARLSRCFETRDKLAGLRLGCIGEPSEWLVGSMPESAHVKDAWGPSVIDVPLKLLRTAIHETEATESSVLQHSFEAGAHRIGEPSSSDLEMAARVAAALRRVVRGQGLDACTLRCFDLVKELQTTGCLALSSLLDEDIVAGCEGDLPAALTMLWMQTLTGQTPFMANPQDLNPSANTLWLAHCTIARRMLKGYALRSHFESSLGVGIQGELDPGPITLARIGGTNLREVFLADGELLVNGDSELRCRTQIQVRLDSDVRELLSRPLGNHLVVIRGRWATQLREYHELFVR